MALVSPLRQGLIGESQSWVGVLTPHWAVEYGGTDRV